MLSIKRHNKNDETTKPLQAASAGEGVRFGKISGFRLHKKKVLILLIITLVLAVVAGLYFWKVSRNSQNTKVNYDDTEKYTVAGRELNIPKEFIENSDMRRSTKVITTDDRIRELEAYISSTESPGPEAYIRLAEIYESTNDKQSAIKYYKLALEAINPANQESQKYEGLINEKIKQLEAAG